MLTGIQAEVVAEVVVVVVVVVVVSVASSDTRCNQNYSICPRLDGGCLERLGQGRFELYKRTTS